jgi:betaine reductase
MEINLMSQNSKTVVKGVSYFLAHVPSLIRYGSKPSREIIREPSLLKPILKSLETFEQAVAYPPNQVFIGNMEPDELFQIPSPWYKHPIPNSSRWGAFGEIMPEEEFYGMMKICDEFKMLQIEEGFLQEIVSKLREHPLFTDDDFQKMGEGISRDQLEKKKWETEALPIFARGNRLVGYCQRPQGGGSEEDPNLSPDFMIENLAARASGVMALRNLIAKIGKAQEIDYLIGCGEEAVGDRYNRGGGNLAKAIGELTGCANATGCDVKAFCCAPLHAMVIGAGLVSSNVFNNTAVVAGGSFAKLGMKFNGHLRSGMPILEDLIAGIAVWIGADDNVSPVIRIDAIGKHEISSGSSQQAIFEKLLIQPLDQLGLKLTDIDKFATEMHNPELTEPQGSGNVPKTNYRLIGSYAVMRHEIEKDQLDDFIRIHGMPGFSPTQGHIASAVPVLGHAVRKLKAGEMNKAMFLAKGSLFLGRMTQLADGISFLLEKNEEEKKNGNRTQP